MQTNQAAFQSKEFTLAPGSLKIAGAVLTEQCHGAALAAGWWHDLKTGELKDFNIGEKLMLIVSEVAEGMEGARKGLFDDHVPSRTMLEMELVDAVIRIFDLAGRMGFDMGSAIALKMDYNANRADHKPAARLAENGKTF